MRTVFAAISTSIVLSMCLAQPPSIIYKKNWGVDFKRKRTENGDTVSVSGIFCDKDKIYLYDQDRGAVAVLGLNGDIARVVDLAPVGRGTYFGDDFIIREKEIIFLNTVDKRLEYFDLAKV